MLEYFVYQNLVLKNVNLKMTTIRISGIKEGSLVDGKGVRMTFFLTGCLHNCKKCHNKKFQNFNNGKDVEINELIDDIERNKKLIDGITLSGGDPLFQYVQVLDFLKTIRNEKKLEKINIWLYTGFDFEQVNNDIKELVDVIVDGKYVHSLPKQKWAGSSNQKVYKKIKGEWKNV